MDPVTGLSRKQQIAIGLLIPLGIVGSTVATLVDERGDDACPDQAYECVTLEPGEPIIIGLIDATAPSEAWPISDLRAQTFPRIEGHPIQLDVRRPGCSAKAAADDVRELASDPPDEPPAALVITAACDEAAVPMAQILSDSGITLLTLGEVTSAPTTPAYHLLVEHAEGVLADAVGAIEAVAIRKEGQLLVPRTPLRDTMIATGYPRAG